jgi:hypothetical protein
MVLSSSRLCRNQAFRFKNRLFGFQYHFEFTEADIEAVLSAARADARRRSAPTRSRRSGPAPRRTTPGTPGSARSC